jgi:hypothetical protein
MVFIIACLKKFNNYKILFILLLTVNNVFSSEIKINNFYVKKNFNEYFLFLNHDLFFSGDVFSAIQKGIPIYIKMTLKVINKKKFWLDEEIFYEEKFYQIRFRNLFKKYQISGLLSEKILISDLKDLKDNISNLEWKLGEIVVNESSEFIVRIELDKSKLPKPLLIRLNDDSWNMLAIKKREFKGLR